MFKGREGELEQGIEKNVRSSGAVLLRVRACTRNDTALALCATMQPNFNNPCLAPNSVVTSYYIVGGLTGYACRVREGMMKEEEAGAGVCDARV
jgi:hypothetical protein